MLFNGLLLYSQWLSNIEILHHRGENTSGSHTVENEAFAPLKDPSPVDVCFFVTGESLQTDHQGPDRGFVFRIFKSKSWKSPC